MGTEKRERQKAGRMARMEAELAQMAAARRKRQIIRYGTIAAIVTGAIVLYSVLAGGGDDTGDAAVTTTTAAVTTTTTAAATSEVATSSECPPEAGTAERTFEFAEAPPLCIDANTFYVASMDTTAGTMEMVLDPTRDAASVNNFVFLARNRAYEGVLFHRIINDFMIQGGDVQGLDGLGGPGYNFDGGFPEAGQYRIGSLAMANSQGPSTNGSQFFIVTGPNGVSLPPNYSLFGQVTDGIDVALGLQTVETDAGDKPLEDVVINSVTITEATPEQIEAYNLAAA